MQHKSRKKFCILIVYIFLLISSSIYGVTPYYSIRTQSLAWPRLAGMTHQINLDKQDWYGTFNVTFGYTKSFHENDITRCLFGKESLYKDCDCPFIRISGSRNPDRGSKDWLADYFGLPTDFKSEIFFRPQISNFIVDFSTYIGLDHFVHGLYAEIHAPLVHTKWALNFRENLINIGDEDYVAGYFSTTVNFEDDLVNNFTSFITNCATPNLNAELIEDTLPDDPIIPERMVEFQPLRFSKFNQRCTQTRFSDIYFIFGMNFLQNEDYYLGLNLRVGAPAGGRPKAQFLFEPIVGNGHHPELGAGLTYYQHLWFTENNDTDINLYIDGFVSHLFKTHQCRSFDLVNNGCNSRYMLAMKFGSPAENLFANGTAGNQTNSQAPSAQFQRIFTPVANLTTAAVDVSISVQGEATAFINFHCHNLDVDFGYRFWGRSCEKICLKKCFSTLEKCPNTWVLKGDAHVFGFLADDTMDVGLQDDPIALSGTQSHATIHAGTNNFVGSSGNNGGIDGIRPTRNPGIDDAQFARATQGAVGISANINDRLSTAVDPQQTKTSLKPIFLSIDDIDFDGARTQGISHTIFFNLNYSWFDFGDWYPYLGMGAKVEFASSKCAPCTTTNDTTDICVGNAGCKDCQRCTPSEWGIWFRGGVSFN